jgi:tRNA A37 threonylcarbamoyladenosine synthetase subunit TsaC/SUA5/YrdC
MSTNFVDLTTLLKSKLQIFWNFTVIIHLKKNYKIKIGYILLVLFFILIFGFFLGFSLAKFEITKQIFSAPVFASIFGVLLGIAGLIYSKNKDYKHLQLEQKREILNKILVLKEPFSEKTIHFSKEIIRNFGKDAIIILHNFLLKKLLSEPETHYFKLLEIQMTKELGESIKTNESMKIKIRGESLLYRIYWFFEIFLDENKEQKLKTYRLLIEDIFIITTDTVPGIFCRIEDSVAAKKIYEIKGRSFAKPLAIYTINPVNFILQNNLTEAFLKDFGDKPITLIARAKENTPEFAKKFGFMGIRLMTRTSKFYNFLKENNLTLLGTSANISGEETPKSIADVNAKMIQEISVIDLHENTSKFHSSVVKIDGDNLIILREGLNCNEIIKWAESQGGKPFITFDAGEEKKSFIINQFK